MQLHVEFMNAPKGSMTRAANAVKEADGGIFWWTISIVVLLAMAAFSWIGSIYIFTHPEQPLNYKLLTRIHRVEAIKQFTEKDKPVGKTLTAPELYQKFYPFTPEILANHNDVLRRNYITNFKNRDEKPYFVKGRFRVVHARALTEQDVFTRGIVARAVSVNEDDKDFRNVVIEYVLPTAMEASGREFAAGDLLDIDTKGKKKRLYGSVINVSRLNEDVMVFTVVPLLYGEHLVDAKQKRTITAVPPHRLNMEAVFPITDQSYGSGAAGARLPDVAFAGQ